MNDYKRQKKVVHVSLTLQDYNRLSKLAVESGRTPSGYLRWLLHRHFRENARHAPD